MGIVALDLADDRMVTACHAVSEAALRADDPFASPTSVTAFHASLSSGPTGGHRETWFVPGGDGTVAGWYRVHFHDQENRGRADIALAVHPARRHGGLGTTLLRHAAGRAAASGREILSGAVTAMLDWLTEAEPQLELIDTWNAGTNRYMIAINESLGYTVTGQFRSADLPVASQAADDQS